MAHFDDEYTKDRYRVDSTQDEDQAVERILADEKMLLKLGMKLIQAGPGVIILTPGSGTIECDATGWAWLQPLLAAQAVYAPGGVH